MNKWKILLITAIVCLAILMFIPTVPFLLIGKASYLDLFTKGGLDFFNIIELAAAVGLVVGAILKNKLIALICSIVALVFVVICIFKAGFVFAGIGCWLALAGYIVSLIFTIKAGKEQ